MRLIVVRHAKAIPRRGPKQAATRRSKWIDDRPLSSAGLQELKALLPAFRLLSTGVSTIVSSPLRRAHETARKLATVLPAAIETDVALVPDAPIQEAMRLVRRLSRKPAAIIVGHEPQLSQLVSRLIGAKDGSAELKKPCWCEIEITKKGDALHGELRALLGPRHLRDLAAGGAKSKPKRPTTSKSSTKRSSK